MDKTHNDGHVFATGLQSTGTREDCKEEAAEKNNRPGGRSIEDAEGALRPFRIAPGQALVGLTADLADRL